MVKRANFHPGGVALIPALLVVSIVASSMALLGLSQQLWIRQTETLQDRAQAGALADAGVEGAVQVLSANRYAPAVPSAMDAWAKSVGVELDGIKPAVAIRSAQGLFNLNNLARGGVTSRPDVALFRRLLAALRLDPKLADAAADWIDADSDAAPQGAEDPYYLSQTSPARAGNRPMSSVDELMFVRGFDASVVDALRPFVTALPAPTAVDANAAPAPVLTALFTSPSMNAADRLIKARIAQPFLNSADIVVRAGQVPAFDGAAGVRSAYFVVESDARWGRARRKIQALVHIPPGLTPPEILWRNDEL